jgi:hypothetical protein
LSDGIGFPEKIGNLVELSADSAPELSENHGGCSLLPGARPPAQASLPLPPQRGMVVQCKMILESGGREGVWGGYGFRRGGAFCWKMLVRIEHIGLAVRYFSIERRQPARRTVSALGFTPAQLPPVSVKRGALVAERDRLPFGEPVAGGARVARA